jgi:hypothetical protein
MIAICPALAAEGTAFAPYWSFFRNLLRKLICRSNSHSVRSTRIGSTDAALRAGR